MSDALNEKQVREVKAISELEVRRYFDHYLNTVFPEQAEALRTHSEVQVESHNDDREAHGGVEKRLNKMVYLAIGAAGAGGTGLGISIPQLLSVLGGG